MNPRLKKLSPLILSAVFLTHLSVKIHAAETDAVSPAIVRYEQMLVASPENGPSFDKIYQYYLQGAGLEALAERWKQSAAKSDANKTTFLILEGMLSDRRGKTQDARAFYQEAAKAQPDNYRIWAALGQLESSDGKLNEAIQAYSKALECKPDATVKPDLYAQLARTQQRNLNDAAALEVWKKLIGEFPEDAFALQEAGAAFLSNENFDDARLAYEKLGKLSEENSYGRIQSMVSLAEVDERQGKYQDAIKRYEAALPKTSDASWQNRDLRARIEQIYRRQDDLPGLAAYYEKWINTNPRDAEANLRLANTLDELGRKDDALNRLKKGVELAPDRNEIKATLVTRLMEASKFSEAVLAAKALTQADATDPHYWELLGEAQWREKQPATSASKADAITSWRKVAPLDSKQPETVVRLAEIFRAHGLDEEAIQEYRRAIELNPQLSDIRLRFADYLMSIKREEEAQKVWDSLVEGNGATLENYSRLANAYRKYERTEDTYRAIDAGLALDPKNFELLQLKWNMLVAAQNWEKALPLFDQIAAAAPNKYALEQLEAMQTQLLTSAGKADETTQQLMARLDANPPLTEGEIRILLRLLEAKNSPEEWDTVMARAKTLYPTSSSLVRLEIIHARKAANYEVAIVGVRKLIALSPEQKTELLAELARIYQESGKPEDAIAVAQQLIEASPANTVAYLTYADLSLAMQKNAEAIAKLKDAIRLADKPNDIRLRLARIYQDTGDYKKARDLYEEAFEAAENPPEKLSLMKSLTEAYYQEGQLDQLLEKLRQKQKGEEGGWRYGMYLSEVYQQLQDYGGARRELSLSLASRPKDESLLRQLIALSKKENNPAEELRYRQMLAEINPAVKEQIALANQYTTMSRLSEAWQIVQNNASSVTADPAAWREILVAFKDSDYATKSRNLIMQSMAANTKDTSAQVMLGELFLSQGDFAMAKEILWKVFSTPLPPETPPAAPPAGNPPNSPVVHPMNVFQQRLNQGNQFQNSAQQMLQRRQSGGGYSSTYYSGGSSAPALSQALINRDRAVVYLAVIALQENKPEEFVKELQKKVEELHLDSKERLAIYSIVQAQELLLAEMELQAKVENPDNDLDQICLNTAANYFYSFGQPTPETAEVKRAKELRELFTKRINTNAPKNSKPTIQSALIQSLNEARTANDKVKLKQITKDYIATLDLKTAPQLMIAASLALQAGDYPQAGTYLGEVAKLKKNPQNQQSNLSLGNQLTYFPLNILQSSATAEKSELPAITALATEAFLLSYPDTPPRPVLGGSSANIMRNGNPGGFFPNRFFDNTRLQMLQQFFQQLKVKDGLPLFTQQLETQEKSLTGWQKVYPLMTRAYFAWWDGNKEKAEALVRDVLAIDSSDDIRLTLAFMLTQDGKYADALKLLEETHARYGPLYVFTQQLLLRAAKMAKNNEAAKKAALRLVALNLPNEDRNALIEDLRQLGLTQKADELTKQNAARGSSQQNGNAEQKMVNDIRAAQNAKDTEKAVTLAKQVLARDPNTSSQSGLGGYARSEAIRCLTEAKALPLYIEEIKKLLAIEPDSLRLNLQLAEASDTNNSGNLSVGIQIPIWLKLKREGSIFKGSISYDGTTWVDITQAQANLSPNVYIGVATASLDEHPRVEVLYDHISMTGKITDADPNKSGWIATDINTPRQKSEFEEKAPDILRLSCEAGNIGGPADSCLYAYKRLSGDGEIIAKVANFDAIASYAKGGLMMRETLEPGSVRVAFVATKSGTAMMLNRTAANARTDYSNFNTIYTPVWMKMERKDKMINTYFSSDKKTWNPVHHLADDMPPLLYIGILCGEYGRGGEGTQAVWEDVSIEGALHPVDANAKKSSDANTPESIPPWTSVDFQKPSTPGYARVTDGKIEIGAPGISNNGNPQRFLYQTVEGDFTMVGKLLSLGQSEKTSNTSANGWTALAIRTSAKEKGSAITLESKSNHSMTMAWRMEGSQQALDAYRKVAAMSATNIAMQMKLAQQLTNRGYDDAAADIMLKYIKQDLPSALQRDPNSVVQSFNNSGRIEELVAAMEAWTPPSNPNGGPNSGYIYDNIGEQLSRNNQIELAVRVFRKGLATDIFGNEQLPAHLIDALITLDRKEEAQKALEDIFFPPLKTMTAPILGRRYNTQNNRMSFINYGFSSSNGEMYSPISSMFYQADSWGFLPALAERCNKEIAAQPDNLNYHLFQIFLKIMARDVSYRESVERLLSGEAEKKAVNKQPLTQLTQNPVFFYILAKELSSWRQEWPMALKVAQFANKKTMANPGNTHMQLLGGRMTIAVAEDTENTALATQLLKETAANFQTAIASGQNNYDSGGLPDIVNLLLAYGMSNEAYQLIKTFESSTVFRNNNYLKERLDPLNKDAEWLLQQSRKPGLAISFVPGKSKDTKRSIYWETNVSLISGSSSPYQPSIWLRTGKPQKLKSCDLEILAGTKKENLKRVTVLKDVASSGVASANIPATATLVQAILTWKSPADPAASPAPSASPVPSASPTPASSPAAVASASPQPSPAVNPVNKVESNLLIPTLSQNLIVDPDFITLLANGKSDKPAWKSPNGYRVTQKSFGSTPKFIATKFSTNLRNNKEMEITGTRIPVEQKTAYAFSAWTRSSENTPQIDLRILDAAGKIIQTISLEHANPNMNWAYRQVYCVFANPLPGQFIIPANAAFFEPVLKSNWSFEIANLRLNKCNP
ncbi:MAG: tetratricopeptide repeat protein [Chthoniobacterales bacterium]